MPSRVAPPQERSQSHNSWSITETAPAPTVSTSRIESALKIVSKKSIEYQRQLKELESRLAQGLSDFRTIDTLLQEASTGLQRDSKRADRAANYQVPQMFRELDESMDTLNELHGTLPTIQSHVSDIRVVYDSGREKAQMLVSDLTWLNTEFYERWRRIIFTSTSPVSWRWKVYMRSLFIISFLICARLFCIALIGAYRAHSHRLVWGDRLMS